jgi:hypothetical protein
MSRREPSLWPMRSAGGKDSASSAGCGLGSALKLKTWRRSPTDALGPVALPDNGRKQDSAPAVVLLAE